MSGWNLKLDEVHNYAWQFNVFSKEECSKIITYATQQDFQKAVTSKPEKSYIRANTNVHWLSPKEEIAWVHQRLADLVLHVNEKYFKFNLFGLNESLQFTHYHKKGACYKKHVDRGYNGVVRKLSVSIQLTESSLYKGCDLLLYDSETPHICNREIGSATVFPSYTLHEVTELQQGERFALVTWVTGESFK
jgi:PKHD-type hydroxylase